MASQDGKDSARTVGDLGWSPGSGRSPGEGNSYPLQYSCLENSIDGGARGLQRGRLDSATNNSFTLVFHGSSACSVGDPSLIPRSGRSPGEELGYPLQYSWASLLAQMVKNPPAMRETRV